ncbi:hypothetical protein BDB00DRAFT_882235 [Zychaea mexicana]|uniref:uncharacterized protein n=1 Tax=Zychaea mexicana TaxID=64656 RepID=UPI0022FE01FE|nr:uncharacterized protein BDB00DRAFT_882235 [Zychaea mexicana]KAI9496012.1 hypothetical protein BDB00DRAFT_882235 [Zychaea mexicana]
MPSATKFHRFKRKNFQGLVYCDYCEKLLWGLARQGVHCIECGYNCHEECSKMVVQCRPPRRISPDSLSVTDSEAESLSKYTSPRGSMHQDDIFLQHASSNHSHSNHHNNKKRTPPAVDTTTEALRSPTFSTATSNTTTTLNNNNNNDHAHRPSPTLSSSVKAYRKSLKQHVQNTIVQAVPVTSKIVSNNQYGVLSPQTTAKAFARSTTTASQALTPRYDENSPEYYANLERTQQSMLFLIRIYDNIAYHLGHIWLSPGSYRLLAAGAMATSVVFWVLGRWVIMLIGLVILVNKTWVGSTAEVCMQFLLELMQTAMDVLHKLVFATFATRKTSSLSSLSSKPVEVSVYENQRWWAGSGYTSQLLRSERAGWSNLTGSEPLPGKDEMPAPASYEWGETGWELDITGPWTDEQLGIGKL